MKTFRTRSLFIGKVTALIVMMGIGIHLIAQPMLRPHTITQLTTSLVVVPADQMAPGRSYVEYEESRTARKVLSNGIPEHRVGRFPNAGNPHRISAQRYQYRLAKTPLDSGERRPVAGYKFGVAVNGVPFDPGAAEFFLGRPSLQWQYEALSNAVPLGLDENHAHVQPGGQYHYHGLPNLLLEDLKVNAESHSPLIGWAADGSPIYAMYGYKNADDPMSEIIELKSGYRLRQGERPAGQGNPGGYYDGTFVGDYEHRSEELKLEQGFLDECNGRYCVTPEFPDGTYAYFMTTDWPMIPRVFHGTPSQDFRGGPGAGPPGGGPGGPPRRFF